MYYTFFHYIILPYQASFLLMHQTYATTSTPYATLVVNVQRCVACGTKTRAEKEVVCCVRCLRSIKQW